MNATEELALIAQLVDYFAPEYPGTRDKTRTYDKLATMLNCHIADRYKNGIVFIGHINGDPVYQWLANAKTPEDAMTQLRNELRG